MCPMRFILVFFSLFVAGYLACKAFWTSGPEDLSSADGNDAVEDKKREGALKMGCVKFRCGMWTLVEMASGRYLWRAVTSQSMQPK
ncbi:hypothetical protein KP509_37G046200 [Ceratopteris richardii]|uniref:Secreted protein n=1 Tax=Ceratopteris richardii TaxID=49495 RepID=A0A8T2Q8A9_CERRI|nr:hypothetical protein KP509_37G046200 [Ceratopteris richardii]